MKRTKKRIVIFITFGLAFVLLSTFLIVWFSWENLGYEYKDGDLVLEISVDKTDVSVGDEIEVTTVFKNLSGRKLRISQISKHDSQALGDVVETSSGILEKHLIIRFSRVDDTNGLIFVSRWHKSYRKTLKQGVIFKNVSKMTVPENYNEYVYAYVYFIMGNKTTSSIPSADKNYTVVYSKIIKLNINQGE